MRTDGRTHRQTDITKRIFAFRNFANASKKDYFLFNNIIYRVSQEERAKLREGVPYIKLHRYNPKHLYPKLNGYGDNGQRKVWTSCISA